MNQELQFEAKPIVIVDYLTTKLTGIDNELLAHQVEIYSTKKMSEDENFGRYEDSELPDSKPINDFKKVLKDALEQAVRNKIKINSLWGHVTLPQAATEYHHHVSIPMMRSEENQISCVYYCRTPEKCGDLFFRLTAGFREYIVKEEPEVGKLVIFPSEVPHMTGKNASDINRVSISANFKLI